MLPVMARPLAVPILLALAGAAHAGGSIDGEVSAGAGGDTTAPDGFAAATASVSASLDGDEVSLVDRALATGPLTDADGKPLDGTRGYMWIFTGLDPDERISVGAAASGELHLVQDGAVGVASGRAWLHAYGWGAEVRTALQPIGDLRDRFWRPGRDVVQENVAVDIPAMFALGSARRQFLALLTHLDLGHRTARLDGAWHAAGWDREVALTFARLQQPGLAFDFLIGRYDELGVATAQRGATEYGTSATTIDLDFVAARWHPAAGLELSGRVGLAMRMPVAPYMTTGTTENSVGPVATTPDVWLEARRTGDASSLSLGAGTWARLDPTGQAADAGELVAASSEWRTGRYQLGGELDIGRLRRVAIGDDAPAGLAPVGTRMWMGRGALLARVRVARDLDLAGSIWVERSDRDDPRWLVPSDGRLATHAGADLTACWRFHPL